MLVAAGVVGAASVGACVAITGVDDLAEVLCTGASCSNGLDAGMSSPDGDAGALTPQLADGTTDSPSIPCAAGLVACAGQCVDPTTNGENCGACGHSCLGGSCTSSACQPITLATVGGTPVGIAVSATTVYYTSLADAPDGLVGSVPVNGGQATTLVPALSNPRHVAVNGQHIYWVETGAGGSVMMANLDGTNPTVLGPSLDDPWDVHVDGTGVYWANEGTGDGGVGAVQTCATTGCVQPTTLAGGLLERPSGVATTATAIYWTNHVTGGSVYTCAKNGSTQPSPLASAQNDPSSLAISGSNAYWVNDGDGTVMTIPLGGSSMPTQLIPPPPPTGSSGDGYSMPIAVDTSNVYFTNQTALTILSCAVGGCGGVAKVLATGQTSAGIAVDATAIYWTDYARGTVMRLAK
jgi:hypothetical protein